MSPDRREGQPPPKVELLRAVPKLDLAFQASMEEVIEENFDVIHKDPKLIVSQLEYKNKYIPSTRNGSIYVHDRESGLINYLAVYKNIKGTLYMESAVVWDYSVIKDPDDEQPPILTATEIAVHKPSAIADGSECLFKSILNLHSRDHLLFGEGEPEDFYDEDRKAYDAGSKTIFDSVREQMNRIPNFPTMH